MNVFLSVSRSALFAALFLVCAGCAEPTVVRLVDGREIAGRFVSDRAYALYAAGAEAEARGDDGTALRFFEAAAHEDERSVEVWTRIGGVLCRLGGASRARAAEAFEKAENRDPAYEPLWRERAACALAEGHVTDALLAVERAVVLDPDRDETVILFARILEGAGRANDARRELVALAIRRPSSAEAWAALEEHAVRTRDSDLAAYAGRMVRKLLPSRAPEVEADVPALAPLAEIDAALVARDLATARRRAKSARVSPAELAARAAALGLADVAKEQAELVLAADPGSSTARVALAVAADLSHDDAALGQALRGVPRLGDPSLVPPSPLARLLFAELLARRIGVDAATAWMGGADAAATDAPDPLLAMTRTRVRERLVRP